MPRERRSKYANDAKDTVGIASQVESLSSSLAQKAKQTEVFLKSDGININDFDEPTRQTFLEAQGIDVNYVLGKGNVKPENTTFYQIGKNLFNPEASDFLENKYISAGGPIWDHADYYTSGLIDVTEGDVVVFSKNGSANSPYSMLYLNASKSNVQTFYLPSQVGTTKTIPAGVAYIRVTFHRSVWSDKYAVQIEKNPSGTVTSFEKFGYTLSDGRIADLQTQSNDLTTKMHKKANHIYYYGGNNSAETFPRFDTVNKTLTIPKGVVSQCGFSVNYQYHDVSTWNTGTTFPLSLDFASGQGILLFNVTDKTIRCVQYNAAYDKEKDFIIGTIAKSGDKFFPTNMICPYFVDGKFYGMDFATGGNQMIQNSLDAFVKGIAHRGWEIGSPENTLPSFRMAKENGYSYVETDVSWTSDNIPVLLHDSTINRTARNADGTEIATTLSISDITLAQAKTYDFGRYLGSQFAGTKIPTLEEFILLCKKLSLHPYIELKWGLTDSRAQIAVNIVKRLGMLRNVTWISFDKQSLTYILQYDNKARVGFISDPLDQTVITNALSLKNGTNEVFLSISQASVTKELSDSVLEQGLELEVWTLWSNHDVETLVSYGVTGMTVSEFNLAERLQK
jgi:glycerophosphoryl diester phosphodiesterase